MSSLIPNLLEALMLKNLLCSPVTRNPVRGSLLLKLYIVYITDLRVEDTETHHSHLQAGLPADCRVHQ